jgi:prepilin-type processing-associated H-X9-DG protein
MKTLLQRIPPRRGLSLTEVVICVGCLVLLVVIALPWLLTARSKSRDQTCLVRSKSAAMAIVTYAESHGDHLPYLVDQAGWPVELLPFLDVPEAIRDGKPAPEADLKTLAVPKYVCPDDPRAQEEKGILSYVVNGGYGNFPVDPATGAVSEAGTHSAEIDLDGDGTVTDRERDINYSTGVCWRPDSRPEGVGFRVSLPWISEGDGLQFTLLLSENLNGGQWLSRETMDLAFVIGREQFLFAEEPGGENPLRLTKAELGPFAINGDLGKLPRHCPAPSSLHGEYVHALYADGHGGPLSEKIDPLAYARLLTSNGARFGQGGDAPVPVVEER